MNLGIFNLLSAKRRTLNGYYLVDDEGNEVLLPNKYVPGGMKVGDEISVFIFKDSEDRITATTIVPLIMLNEFAVLEVLDINPVGAFLDWGLEKDLLVPYSEQNERMNIGKSYPVYLFLDEDSQRLVATCKINRYLEAEDISVKNGQEVDLLICNPTDLGINVIINNLHRGLIYDNELFQAVSPGERLTGYIKLIRPDNKIDVSLQKQGYVNVEPNSKKILEKLKENNGFMNLTDKTDPIIILAKLEMSKKVFKKAIGALYKQKLIRIEKDGIYLVTE
ncbi:MAG: GntR family transcriptional regulator [Bacteroidetes bacterium]|nr:GntR family transcriptional regulator [Bacteroidota bacterium]